jgi:hypothetical protein
MLQDALAMPLGDQQAQVAQAHRRTTAVMAQLRATMRDEHSFLVQVTINSTAAARKTQGSSVEPCAGRLNP